MALYPYVATLAVDPQTLEKAAGATGVIYAPEDTNFASPLTATDSTGNPIPLTSNTDGVLPSFYSTAPAVNWRSGSYVFPLVTSMPLPGPEGAPGDPGRDGVDGSNVIPTAEAIAAEIQTPGTPANTALSDTYAGKPDNGARPVGKGEIVLNVMDYGAVGDGVADDTAAIQAAINALTEHQTLYFPGRHNIPGNLTINKKYWTFTGRGTLLNGKVVIGSDSGTRQDQYWTITGLNFERSGNRTADTYAIELLKTRRGTIENSYFLNMDKAIYVRPITTAIDHDTAQIKVVKNEFAGVNYAFYVDRADSVSWMHTSDCKFLANTVNVAHITHVYAKSIDGLVCKDNVFFFPSYNTTNTADKANKKHNIYVGQSDWVIINGNNCFESGEEAIVMDMAKHFTISDNLIAWPGQKGPYDAIKFTGQNNPNGAVTDNIISRFSGNALGVYTTGNGTIIAKNNVCEYDAATGTYYGTPALNTFTHYGMFQAPTSTETFIESGNEAGALYHNRKGSLLSAVRLNKETGLSASKASVSVTAANTPIFTLTATSGSTVNFSGTVLLDIRNTETDAGNMAAHQLHLSKHALGVSLTEVSKHGLTGGNAANWPSFTFTLDTAGRLCATPVGSTSGTFHFVATCQGNIRLMKP